MTRSMKQWASVLSIAVLGVAGSASAGYATESAYCYKNSDGSGSCYGSMLGFRNHSDSGTYARFYKSYMGGKSFYARFPVSGTLTAFSCTPDADVSTLWSTTLGHHGYFQISWDTTGTCTYLRLHNGSQFANF